MSIAVLMNVIIMEFADFGRPFTMSPSSAACTRDACHALALTKKCSQAEIGRQLAHARLVSDPDANANAAT